MHDWTKFVPALLHIHIINSNLARNQKNKKSRPIYIRELFVFLSYPLMNPPISTAPGPTYCWKQLQFCWIRNRWSVLWAKTWCNIEMDRSLWSRHFSLLCHRELRRQRLQIAWRSEAILGRLRRSPCTGQSQVWNSFFDKQTHTYTRERKMSGILVLKM